MSLETSETEVQREKKNEKETDIQFSETSTQCLTYV